jgi:hypothetical protein
MAGLPDHIRRAIYGEVSVEEKREALSSSHAAWKAERNKEPPVPGTTKGDFADLGLISNATGTPAAVSSPPASTDRKIPAPPTDVEARMGLRAS